MERKTGMDAQQIASENFKRWQSNPGTYEFIPEREICRLVKYKKTFSEDVLVKRDGVPLILRTSGKPLRACDVLPERADLALDMDGNLLSQGDFKARYYEWLGSFTFPEGTEIGLEPCPEVSDYVSREPDRYSESNGYIEIYFDPKLNQEWTPSEKYDTEGRTQEEREAEASASVNNRLVEALMQKLSGDQVAELLGDVMGKDVPLVGESAE